MRLAIERIKNKKMETLFKGVFDNELASAISIGGFFICIMSSLIIGFVIAAMYMYKSTYSKSFIITLATLPAIVCAIIMMVNGNVGAGVAVAGAFSLVRFRSVPGSAREIGSLFLAMSAGLIIGMGYIGYAFAFVIIVGFVSMFYTQLDFGEKKAMALNKTMRITIPEDIDYSDVFEDIFEKYTTKCELMSVKTTNMGSLFKLTYNMTYKSMENEKVFIDEIRCRNGNLEVSVSCHDTTISETL